jgi:4-amino-4-deoxy-L-arabinose transferase-like glycosyltransferase
MLYKFRWQIFLTAIIIFAAILRMWQLGQMPSGFHRDEVDSGYIGRFTLQNGRDIYGNPFPLLYIDKYGDYPPSIPMYFSGLSTYIFGPTVFSTRFPVAFLGALMLLPLYFLMLELFKDERIALFSTLLMAILPWQYVLSRATAEGIIALFFATIALLYLIKFVHTQKLSFLIVSFFLFASTYLLYPSYRVLVPLIFLPIPFVFHLKRKNFIASLLVLGIFLLLTLVISRTAWGRGRFDQTSMFGGQNATMTKVRSQIFAAEEGTNHTLAVKFYHNKYILYGKEILNQYLSYFSPQYLFTIGGLPYRYSVSDEGLLYLTCLPLLLFSFIYFRGIEKRIGIFLLYLLFISPLPAPITLDDVPNTHRTLFMVLPLTILASYGFFACLDSLKKPYMKKVFMGIVFGFLLVESVYFLHMYYHHANAVKSVDRDDTNKEMIQYVISQRKAFYAVYLPAHESLPLEYLYFANNFSSTLLGKIHKGLTIDSADNVTFTDTYCPSKFFAATTQGKNVLFVDRDDCEIDPNAFKVQTVFTRHDGTTSYRVLVRKG